MIIIKFTKDYGMHIQIFVPGFSKLKGILMIAVINDIIITYSFQYERYLSFFVIAEMKNILRGLQLFSSSPLGFLIGKRKKEIERGGELTKTVREKVQPYKQTKGRGERQPTVKRLTLRASTGMPVGDGFRPSAWFD